MDFFHTLKKACHEKKVQEPLRTVSPFENASYLATNSLNHSLNLKEVWGQP